MPDVIEILAPAFARAFHLKEAGRVAALRRARFPTKGAPHYSTSNAIIQHVMRGEMTRDDALRRAAELCADAKKLPRRKQKRPLDNAAMIEAFLRSFDRIFGGCRCLEPDEFSLKFAKESVVVRVKPDLRLERGGREFFVKLVLSKSAPSPQEAAARALLVRLLFEAIREERPDVQPADVILVGVFTGTSTPGLAMTADQQIRAESLAKDITRIWPTLKPPTPRKSTAKPGSYTAPAADPRR